MNLNVWELTMCLPSEAPREASIMRVIHKLALVGASCAGMSLHQVLCQPHFYSCCSSRVQANILCLSC